MAIPIIDFVKMNFPETFDVLVQKYTSPDLVDTAVQRALGDLFVAGTVEGDLSDFLRAYTADKATLYLIPTGIDHWAVQGQLAEGARGEGVTYYDRVKALQQLTKDLADRLADQEDQFEEEAGALIPTHKGQAIPRIDSTASDFKTTDPQSFGTPHRTS